MHEKYDQVVASINAQFEAAVSLADCEEMFVRLLESLKDTDHPKLRNKVVGALSDQSLPWEAIQFCMRELRWVEVEKAAKELRANTDDFRIKRIMNHILSVYEENWEDGKMYRYYAQQELR